MPPEQLELLLGDGLEMAVRQRYESHVRGCPACAAELDLLRGFLNSAPGPDEEKDLAWIAGRLKHPAADAPAASKPNWFQAWTGFSPFSKVAVSLATLLLIVAGALQLRQFRTGAEKVHDAGGPAVLRSTEISLAGPAGDVSARPVKLSWSPVGSAVRYEAVVEEVDGAELWRGESAAPEAVLPPSLQSQIVPLKTLVWRVSAFNARGDKIAESQKARFRLVE